MLALFAAVGLTNIGNDAFIGQDFSLHVGNTNRLLGRPDAWFSQDVTSRPMIYWIAIHGIALTDNRAPYAFAAGVFLLFNTGALWLFHDLLRRCIRPPALRLGALTVLAFLPATLITTVVFAADAMALPLFILLAWATLRWSESPGGRTGAVYTALAGAALTLGNFAKFTFIVLPAGLALVAWLAWRWQRVDGRRTLWFLAVAVAAPALIGLGLHRKSSAELSSQPQWHTFTWQGTGEMTWRSLLTVKPSDARIFDAPGYWDSVTEGGQKILPLLLPNNYSYPALLHLGTFTDVLDFSNGGSQRSGAPRPQPQKSFSQWAVRTGVLFSLPCVFAVGLMSLRVLRAGVVARHPPNLGTAMLLVLALNWFVPLVITLPFVRHAYDWGYWLPRLVLPALWGFGLCLFSWIDELAATWPRIVPLVAAACALQAALQICSVWY